jgi:hypothetical protein
VACGGANITHVGKWIVVYIKTNNFENVLYFHLQVGTIYKEISTAFGPRYSYSHVPKIWAPWYSKVHMVVPIYLSKRCLIPKQ